LYGDENDRNGDKNLFILLFTLIIIFLVYVISMQQRNLHSALTFFREKMWFVFLKR